MCRFCNLFKKKPEPEPEIIIPEEREEKFVALTAVNLYDPSLNCDLRGCVQDAEFLKYRLIKEFGYPSDNIRVLLDRRASTAAIEDHLYWLIDHKDSRLFGAFSGHGTQGPDYSGDEADGLDEAICPTDMDFNNLFTDDKIGNIFKEKPDSSSLTFLFDCCHGGTPARGIFKRTKERLKNPIHQPNVRFLQPPRHVQHDIDYIQTKDFPVKTIINRLIPLKNTILSGCLDHQTSADAYISGKWRGAFTYFFGKYFHPTNTYNGIYEKMLSEIKAAGYSQTPQFNGAGLDGLMLGGGL